MAKELKYVVNTSLSDVGLGFTGFNLVSTPLPKGLKLIAIIKWYTSSH